MNLDPILREVLAEFERGRALHPGTDDLPDGTGGGGRRAYERIAKLCYERAAREGRLTMLHGLEEEFCEVAAAEGSADIRRELVQVAAYCVKWIAAIDAREGAPA
jgi:hypothetical protein